MRGKTSAAVVVVALGLGGGVVVAAVLHPEPDNAFKPAAAARREGRAAALDPAQRVHGQRHRQHQARHEREVNRERRE